MVGGPTLEAPTNGVVENYSIEVWRDILPPCTLALLAPPHPLLPPQDNRRNYPDRDRPGQRRGRRSRSRAAAHFQSMPATFSGARGVARLVSKLDADPNA